MVKVEGAAKLFPPDEDIEVPILAQFADYLFSEVRAITVDNNGLLTVVSTDPEEDDTLLLPIIPTQLLNHYPIAVQYSILNFKSSIGLDQALTSQHTPTNSGLLKRLPSNSIPWKNPKEYRCPGMYSIFSEAYHHNQISYHLIALSSKTWNLG
jgi:hypothetical protein